MKNKANERNANLIRYWKNEALKMEVHKKILRFIFWAGTILVIVLGVSVSALSKYELFVVISGCLISVLTLVFLIANIPQRIKRLENYSRDLLEVLFKYQSSDLEDSTWRDAFLDDIKHIRNRHGFGPE